MSEVKTHLFKANARKALADQGLQKALDRVMDHFDEARRVAIEDITPVVWDELRNKASRIKGHVIQNLDYYLELLEASVSRAGGVVHFARTAQDANAVIEDLVRSRGVRLVVKGKSMVSEELGINNALEQIGVEVVETDLGEYIIQLAAETPFHIIAPAMHKSKEEVSDLFTKNLGTPPSDDIQRLCQIARDELRQKFTHADMGMTGVNFAVAETGTIVLVTNEGNGRMCTSLPRIHVALMGMEKIVPSLKDLGVFLPLLTRAATGQKITSYFTFVTGPRRHDDEDGPEEFHLIILDNGRSRLLEDPDLREALNCIRCGACLNVCPVYSKVGGHAYGWVYPGPIGAVVTPMLTNLEGARDLPFASTLCGACREVCPVNINLPHMLLRLRQLSTERSVSSRGKKAAFQERIMVAAWRWVMTGSWRLDVIGKIGGRLLRSLDFMGVLRYLPPPFSGWTRTRDFPIPSTRSFRARWKDVEGKTREL